MNISTSYLRVFSVLLFSFVSDTHAYNKYITAFHRHMDRRVRCGIMKTLYNIDPQTCRKTCAETVKCFSVNIWKGQYGLTICELVKGSRVSLYNKDCVQRIVVQESENSEFEYTQTCSVDQKECSPKQHKKVLPDGWYQLGRTAYKLFTEHLNWHKAVAACAEKGAAIAQIKNEDENQFVTLLLEERPRTEKKLPSTIRPVGHWKLDGTDQDLELFGDAKFQKDTDQVTNVLHLPSTAVSYAETPSYDIRSTGFTVSFWAKMLRHGYVYSRWGSPYHFVVGVWVDKIVMHIVTEYQTKNVIFKIPTYVNRWAHYTAVWDRANATAILYLNGKKVHEVKYHETYTAIKPGSLSSKFDVGLKRDSRYSIVGSLSQLYLFDRVLTSKEVKIVRDSFYMGNSAWISLNDITTEGRYMIDDSQVASYINLAPGQIAEDVQDCVSIRAWDEGKMDVNHCLHTVLPYVCMKQV